MHACTHGESTHARTHTHACSTPDPPARRPWRHRTCSAAYSMSARLDATCTHTHGTVRGPASDQSTTKTSQLAMCMRNPSAGEGGPVHAGCLASSRMASTAVSHAGSAARQTDRPHRPPPPLSLPAAGCALPRSRTGRSPRPRPAAAPSARHRGQRLALHLLRHGPVLVHVPRHARLPHQLLRLLLRRVQRDAAVAGAWRGVGARVWRRGRCGRRAWETGQGDKRRRIMGM